MNNIDQWCVQMDQEMGQMDPGTRSNISWISSLQCKPEARNELKEDQKKRGAESGS